MDAETVNEILDTYIKEYDQALNGIRQCISAYEENCIQLIDLISKSSSLSEANEYFDILYSIQGKLYFLLF